VTRYRLQEGSDALPYGRGSVKAVMAEEVYAFGAPFAIE
jgi:hypothetical protein